MNISMKIFQNPCTIWNIKLFEAKVDKELDDRQMMIINSPSLVICAHCSGKLNTNMLPIRWLQTQKWIYLILEPRTPLYCHSYQTVLSWLPNCIVIRGGGEGGGEQWSYTIKEYLNYTEPELRYTIIYVLYNAVIFAKKWHIYDFSQNTLIK